LKESEELSRTPAERAFLAQLLTAVPDLDVWRREEEDRETPWLCVSVDRVTGGNVSATPRLDFDDAQYQGGFS
jgi:hypothetical protein